MSEYKEVGIEDIISVVKKKKGRRDTKIIQKAYDYAKAKHGDQLRKSGEPYISILCKLHIHLQIWNG